jgi:hypothetical protein
MAFVERLYKEERELSERVGKLESFIEINPKFEEIEEIERVLCVTQLNCMKMYLYTLQERIYQLKNNRKNG